jgi:hypothetical protein
MDMPTAGSWMKHMEGLPAHTALHGAKSLVLYVQAYFYCLPLPHTLSLETTASAFLLSLFFFSILLSPQMKSPSNQFPKSGSSSNLPLTHLYRLDVYLLVYK